MKFLLDSSVVIAANIAEHPHFDRANQWLKENSGVLCPIAELAFLRVAGQVYNVPLDAARASLETFKARHAFKPCDLSALDGHPAPSAKETTDYYLGNLAEKHGLKWATLDSNSKHPAAIVI